MSVTRRRRRPALRLLLVAAVTLPLVACGETSRVDPDATVVLSGRALAPAGTPLTDRPVRLVSISDADDAALGLLTLGLGCAGDACDDDIRTATTNAAGAYRLELQGRDTQTAFGNVRPQALSVSAGPRKTEVSGASVTARFVVQDEQVALPALRLVDPALSLGSAPGRVGATWRTGAAGPYELTFETDDVLPVWRVTTAGRSATVDARVLEGTAGRTVLSGGSEDMITGSDVDIQWRSPGLGYAASSEAPVSRGSACTYGQGPSATTAQTCSLTDGDLFRTELSPAGTCPSPAAGTTPPPCPAPATVSISVPASPAVELVVVRGCTETCAVEASSDGTTFRAAGRVTSEFGAVRVSGAATVVRVGLGSEGLREVSVWGPSGAEPGLRPVGVDAVGRLRAPYADAVGQGLPTAVLVLAGALCLAGVLGVGFLLGRRLRTASPAAVPPAWPGR